jgi:hypothetical protein
MSVAQTTAPAAGADRGSLLRWIAGGTALAALLAVVAVLAWPASEADKAREDGEQLGEAIGQLYNAQSTTEVDAALDEIDVAVSETRAHAGDELADQADAQADALSRAADGFAGALTTDDAFEADLYEAELDTAMDDLVDNASDFRGQGPEVHQAFWEGVQEGLPA